MAAEDLADGEVIIARVASGPDYYRVQNTGSELFLHPPEGDGAPVAVEESSRLGLVGRVSAFYRRMSPLPAAPVTAH